MVFVIFWDKCNGKRGFVSYDNNSLLDVDEYHPVGFVRASRYATKRDAQRTVDWYLHRGGFGEFRIMKVC